MDDDWEGTERRVLRGGAFYGHVNFVRCANRGKDTPDVRFSTVGLRVMLPGSVF
ncbi:SUMF1/EgtB/PvdO family nonheme iron enzyme [Chloroflexi bacterium TSY]|nr:SUMF1/EgtB/PvdO family nonheme iron enzyme [Chloroflexi bacterium TSY]